MPPEFDIRRGQRYGREYKQLFVSKTSTLGQRVETVSKYYGIRSSEILDVLGDVEDVLLEGKESLFRTGKIEVYTQQYSRKRKIRIDSVFERKLHNLGMSKSHASNLVFAVVDSLAEMGQGVGSDETGRRISAVEELRGKDRLRAARHVPVAPLVVERILVAPAVPLPHLVRPNRVGTV